MFYTLAATSALAGCTVGPDYRPKTADQLGVPQAYSVPADAASREDLTTIELEPFGLGIHFPRLDADFYVPALLEGMLGSRSWMAAQLGAAGGRARSSAKAAASRANGKRGGRPRKTATTSPG